MTKTTNAKVSILHLITAAKNASPFDVNMAYDAGYDKIMPYTNVGLNEVTALTQDAMFSRSPSGIKNEAIFIGGRDIDLAMKMLETAKAAMFTPFECSLFADPSGAFTTAAAMVAKAEYHLQTQFKLGLSHQLVSVFGATGPVGACAAIIAAKQGAKVELVAHNDVANFEVKAQFWNTLYGVNLAVVDGTNDQAKKSAIAQSDVILCSAAAGIEVLNASHLAHTHQLKVAADVNAVSPLGVAGVDVNDDGVNIATHDPIGLGAVGVGALAIGQLKYQTQHQLLKQMLGSDAPLVLDFFAAFALAQKLVADI